jgi:DNA (cytosine-5)-methyltransferase 1
MLLGHTPVCAVEIEPYRRKVLLQRQVDGILPAFPIWDDIKTFDGKPWRGLIDVVCGGFPCQDVSPSGSRKGLSGKKSGLWREMARIICEVRPQFAFVENSAALTVRGLGIVIGDLAEMGFDAKWGVLGASDAIWLDGIPAFDHERYRVFIKASHPDRSWKLQPERGIQNEWRRACNGASETPNSNGIGQHSEIAPKAIQVHQNGSPSIFESARRRIAMPVAAADNTGWWSNEPGVGRVVHGLANRDDRIAAIGDGQVPAVVRLAWETLI